MAGSDASLLPGDALAVGVAEEEGPGERGRDREQGRSQRPAHRPGPQAPHAPVGRPHLGTWVISILLKPIDLHVHFCASNELLLGFLVFCNQKCAFSNFVFFFQYGFSYSRSLEFMNFGVILETSANRLTGVLIGVALDR